jgi:recombination associated protein RdgC
MFKGFTVYKLLKRIPLATLEDALASDPFMPIGLSQEKSVGWTPPRGNEHDAFVEAIGDHHIATFVIETKSVPASAIKPVLDERLAEIEDSTGRKPGKRERRELGDEVRLELLPKAFPKKSHITMWIDKKAGYIVFDSTSQSKIDEVVTSLVRNCKDVNIQLVNTSTSPVAWMAAVLIDSDQLSSKFTIDRECELKASDETKAVVKYSKHPLDIAEVRAHIQQGKMPTKLALTWNDRVSFVLTESLAVKKVVFLDTVFESQSSKENDDDFDADVAIVTGELSALIPELFDELGGELSDGEVKTDPEDEEL